MFYKVVVACLGGGIAISLAASAFAVSMHSRGDRGAQFAVTSVPAATGSVRAGGAAGPE